MPRAVCTGAPDASAGSCSTWSQSSSRGRGTPARTRRGRSTRPWWVGAGATADWEAPAHFVVRRAVEQSGEIDDVDLLAARGESVQSGLHAEADDPDLTGLVDQHVLRRQPAVGDSGGVREGDRVGYLGDQPGRAPRAERPGTGHQDVERDPGAPLVDDVADAVAGLGVQDPEDPAVQDGGRGPGRLQQPGRAFVLGIDHVDGDVPFEHPVVGTPEASALALGEQVDQSIATGEDLTGPDRVRHLFLSAMSRSSVRCFMLTWRWCADQASRERASRRVTVSSTAVTSRICIARASTMNTIGVHSGDHGGDAGGASPSADPRSSRGAGGDAEGGGGRHRDRDERAGRGTAGTRRLRGRRAGARSTA